MVPGVEYKLIDPVVPEPLLIRCCTKMCMRNHVNCLAALEAGTQPVLCLTDSATRTGRHPLRRQ